MSSCNKFFFILFGGTFGADGDTSGASPVCAFMCVRVFVCECVCVWLRGCVHVYASVCVSLSVYLYACTSSLYFRSYVP